MRSRVLLVVAVVTLCLAVPAMAQESAAPAMSDWRGWAERLIGWVERARMVVSFESGMDSEPPEKPQLQPMAPDGTGALTDESTQGEALPGYDPNG